MPNLKPAVEPEESDFTELLSAFTELLSDVADEDCDPPQLLKIIVTRRADKMEANRFM
jgi:hypothetical protein